MKWIKCEIGNKNTFPASGVEVLIKYNNGSQKELGSKETIIELIENGWLKVEWLDETTPEATTPLQEGRELYWQKRCEAAELLLNKHCKEIPDSPEYMNWQSAIEPAATPASTQGRVYVEVEGTKPPEHSDMVHVLYGKNKNNDWLYRDFAYYENETWKDGNTDKPLPEAFLQDFAWLKPLPSTPAPEVTDEEIQNAAKEFAADYGYYPNQIITAFKEGAKFIAGYKAHQGKQ